ncbi:MAG: hypothetical protein AABY22_30120, partial [Nanoarchaeota archaeon]
MLFYSPSSLSLSSLQKRVYNNKTLKFSYIISLIYSKRLHCKLDPNQYVPLKFEFLSRAIGARYTKRVKDALIRAKIIESDRKYVIGEKCIGYRFTEKYRNDRFIERNIENVPKNMKKMGMKIDLDNDEQVYLLENLKKTTIISEAYNFVLSLGLNRLQEDKYLQCIYAIINKHWFFSYDPKTGRVFNNITSLPKLLRPFLRLNGQPIYEYDIHNSQPLFMVQLYKYNCEEKKRFQKLVLSGQFYEFLNEQAQKIYKDRGKLKRGFYRQIAFGTVFGLKYGIAAAFQRNFPILFAEIEKMKLKDYKSLAEKLQTFEANIIIKQVVKQARLNNIP